MRKNMKNIKNKQKGIALPITLLILISLLLSISILIRSSDVSVIVSGNVGVHNQLYGSNSIATFSAINWLNTNSTTLDNDNSVNGYFSSQPQTEVDYNDYNNWLDAYSYNNGAKDSYKNISQYKILRMCSLANIPFNGSLNGIQNICSLGNSGDNTSGSSSHGYDVYNFGITSTTAVYYKIITRTCVELCPGMSGYSDKSKNGLIVTETIVKM